MKLEIHKDGSKRLFPEKEIDLSCFLCGITNSPNGWYFSEYFKRAYCYRCPRVSNPKNPFPVAGIKEDTLWLVPKMEPLNDGHDGHGSDDCSFPSPDDDNDDDIDD